ncbi:19482_t:CDS:2 [Entrophospora sp. SA101]|nr:19482_t:CDS:2 [Entrophospora sp. SA101]
MDQLKGVKGWLDSINIVYYEGTPNLSWNQDVAGFHKDWLVFLAKMDSVGEFKPTESEVAMIMKKRFRRVSAKAYVEHRNSNNDCGNSSSSNGTNTNKKLHQSLLVKMPCRDLQEEVAKRKRDVETHSLALENVQE